MLNFIGRGCRLWPVAMLTIVPFAAQAQTRAELEGQKPEPRAAEAPRVNSDAALTSNCPREIAESTLAADIRSVRFQLPGGASLPDEVDRLLGSIAPPAENRTVQAVCAIRDEAFARLRHAGYVAAVQIPRQALEGNELKLNVILGRLTQVRLIGSAGRYRGLIESRIERLKNLWPLNEREAERVLLLTNDVPGLSVRLDLRSAPSGEVGALVGDLRVEYSPVVVLASVHNYGSQELGRETAYVSASIAGLTGLGDLTTIAGSTTKDFKEQRVLQLGHQTAIGSSGFAVGAEGTFAWSRPDLGALDLRSDTTIGTFYLSAPVRRSRETSLAAVGGLELLNQRTRVFGGTAPVPLNRDRIRVLYARLDGDFQRYGSDAAGRDFERFRLSGSAQLRKGIDAFGASKAGASQGGYSLSRPDGIPTATVVRGSLDGRARLNRVFSIAGRAEAQWASDPLLNLEEYSIGNLTIGRGYDPGANSGDRAIGTRAELRVNVPVDRADRHGVQLFGGYDSVWLWNLDRATTEKRRLIRSFALGVRYRITGLLSAEVAYAHPIDPPLRLPNVETPKPRVLFSLTTRFAPKF